MVLCRGGFEKERRLRLVMGWGTGRRWGRVRCIVLVGIKCANIEKGKGERGKGGKVSLGVLRALEELRVFVE